MRGDSRPRLSGRRPAQGRPPDRPPDRSS